MSLEKYDIKIAKGTTDPRVEKKTFLGHITSSRTINFHLQNLDQASTSKSQPNISISDKLKIQNETKPSFKISTKIRLHNLYKTLQNTNQTPTSKYFLNFNFKILTKPCAQSPNKRSAKSATNFCQHDPQHQH